MRLPVALRYGNVLDIRFAVLISWTLVGRPFLDGLDVDQLEQYPAVDGVTLALMSLSIAAASLYMCMCGLAEHDAAAGEPSSVPA
ncbi:MULTISPECIES: hypothetical protein [Bradyrhizobium]|uniref:hypothetical protein n=1 Tax=Bradyrhizobium elkanii TaxID=29448 RepID=UPI0012BBF5CB|nr:hypothetical protein [Bradyrhizobium elkanii]